MEKLKAKQAWAVAYTPQYFLEMGPEYDADRLEQLNEHLAKGDYALISNETQGFYGDLVIDFPLNMAEPYRALILLEKS
ncbi:MAG: hypothetical protein M0P73_08985 [Syntrophobacterales bacterium]|jgi:hypothetical protein|nr:hypothetical protein [Syntrophobacterales bacterium]